MSNPQKPSQFRNSDLTFSAAGQQQRHLLTVIVFSLLLHLALLAIFPFHSASRSPQPISVTLMTLPPSQPQSIAKATAIPPKTPAAELPPPPKQQLVSPSELPEAKAPPKTTLFSDKNTTTEHQQIKRGLNGGEKENSANSDSKQSEKQKALNSKMENTPAKQTGEHSTKSEKPSASSEHTLSASNSLRLNPEELDKRFGTMALPSEESSHRGKRSESGQEGKREAKLKEYEPFAKKSGLGTLGTFGSLAGSSDYLPDIPDGDITLLNAKADRFAVFVRRVALQVFGSLRKGSWQELPFSQVQQIRDFTTVEGIMGKDGKLVSARIKESSGSAYFDRVLLGAVQQGAWDQNPPSSAGAEDGQIHFIFRSRTWARFGSQKMAEQRWLLLGTGLL